MLAEQIQSVLFTLKSFTLITFDISPELAEQESNDETFWFVLV